MSQRAAPGFPRWVRAEPGAPIGWERWQHQRLAGRGAWGPHVCCPHPWGCKWTWGAHGELQKSALGKLSELTAEHEGAGRCFWGDFLCSLPPRTQRSPRKPGRGKHFATWLLHAPAKETILQLKEEISVPAISNPYCLSPNSRPSERSGGIAPLCMCFSDPLILASQEGFVVLRKAQF